MNIINSSLQNGFSTIRKSSHPDKGSNGRLLFKKVKSSNQPEKLITQELLKYNNEQKEILADEFVESAGRDGLDFLAQTPGGQHALSVIYTHVSKNIGSFLREVHAVQGTTAVDYTSAKFSKSILGNIQTHIVEPGNDLSDPAPLADSDPGEWIQHDDDVLYVDGISCQDIDQGKVGDCSFMATLASVAKSDPEFIKNMITENPDGTYTVRLYDKEGNERNITVDGELYRTSRFSQNTLYAGVSKQGEIWPAIIEKAYAQMMGGYENIENKNATESIMVITGSHWAFSMQHFNPDLVYDRIASSISEGAPVVAATYDDEARYNENGLVEDHAYSVLGIYTDGEGQRWVTLRNPWAHAEYKNTEYTTDTYAPRWDRNIKRNNNDGLFRMKFEDYLEQFQTTKLSGSVYTIPDFEP